MAIRFNLLVSPRDGVNQWQKIVCIMGDVQRLSSIELFGMDTCKYCLNLNEGQVQIFGCPKWVKSLIFFSCLATHLRPRKINFFNCSCYHPSCTTFLTLKIYQLLKSKQLLSTFDITSKSRQKKTFKYLGSLQKKNIHSQFSQPKSIRSL